jgi:hypothetical protein
MLDLVAQIVPNFTILSVCISASIHAHSSNLSTSALPLPSLKGNPCFLLQQVFYSRDKLVVQIVYNIKAIATMHPSAMIYMAR